MYTRLIPNILKLISKMSILRIDTNVLASDIDEELLVQCTESLAKTFQKSKSVSLLINYSFTTICF